MQALQELLANRVLISGLVGWGAAQVLKTIIYALMHHTLDLTRIFGDGGMPSGHSATVCAVATSAGILYGLGSFPFAISVIVAIIVMHDAMGVRLETGKQAKLLNEKKTDLNIVVGLCVGHDSIFYKYSDALCTTLITKDRVLGHNPAAAIYQMNAYYSKLMK